MSLLLVLFTAHLAHAQPPIKEIKEIKEKDFIRYTVMDGLNDNSIRGIVQDANGFLWISTANGIDRFDGREIRRFRGAGDKTGNTDNTGNNDGPWDNDFGHIQYAHHQFVLYSRDGALLIDPVSNSCRRLLVSDTGPGAVWRNDVYDIVPIRDHFALSTGTGFYVLDSAGRSVFRYEPPGKNTSYHKDYGRYITVLDDNSLLQFDAAHHLHLYDARNNTYRPPDQSLPGLYSLAAMNLCLRAHLPDGQILFFDQHSKNLYRYDPVTDKVHSQSLPPNAQRLFNWSTRYTPIDDSTALLYNENPGIYLVHTDPTTQEISIDTAPLFAPYTCRAILKDKEGRLWFATDKGLLRQDMKQDKLHRTDLGAARPSCFLRWRNALYVGSETRGPVLALDPKNYSIKSQLDLSSLSPLCNQVWSMLAWRPDTLWLATQDGLVWYRPANVKFDGQPNGRAVASYGRVHIPGYDSLLLHAPITVLYKDSKDNIWLQGRWRTGIIRYDPHTRQSTRYSYEDSLHHLPILVVNHITEDAEGNLWMGEKGLIRWNRQTAAFDTLITVYTGSNKYNINITGLSVYRGEQLVFSNRNNGISTLDIPSGAGGPAMHAQARPGSTSPWNSLSNLPENNITTLLTLPNGYIWAVTGNFITGLHPSTGNNLNYSYADSLPIERFNNINGIYHDSAAKRMLFGYGPYLVWTTDSAAKPVPRPLPLYIDEIKIQDSIAVFFPDQPITLSYRQNDVTIHFSAIDFDNAGRERFFYRINDGEWLSIRDNRVRLSNMAPGTYHIEISANASASATAYTGATIAIRRITIVIQPPFWRTWWFIGLVSLVLLATAYALIRGKIRRQLLLIRLSRDLATSQLTALHAQMNPHFVFNSLNSIHQMILSNDNQQASHYLGKFAHLIRITLEQSSRAFVTLRQTIDYLNRYVDMEKIRNDHFTFTLEADPVLNPDEVLLPPMLIQPIIENSIWHGCSPDKTIHVTVRFLRNPEGTACLIDDDGIGIDASLRNKKTTVPPHRSIGLRNIRDRVQLLNERYGLHSSLTIRDKSETSGGANAPRTTGTLVTLFLSTIKEEA